MAIEIKDEFDESELNTAGEPAPDEDEVTENTVDTETEDSEDEACSDEDTAEAADDASDEQADESGNTDSEAADDKSEEKPAEASEEKPEKKGLFGKKKDKKDKRDEKIDELTDLLKRNMAEFDNFRKRTEKEKATMYDMGAKSIVEKLLPIVDNFERGLATVSDEEKADNSFANGMDLIYKQILKLFEDLGVEAIETEGKEFDPNLHNAVMHIEDENLGENVIAQEFQKGYTYKGTVIRHSMVQVAN